MIRTAYPYIIKHRFYVCDSGGGGANVSLRLCFDLMFSLSLYFCFNSNFFKMFSFLFKINFILSFACIYEYVCVHVYMHTCMFTYMHVCFPMRSLFYFILFCYLLPFPNKFIKLDFSHSPLPLHSLCFLCFNV